ncbi:MAG: tRNA pseudouridine(38-40) synthase TruA [Clostridia bacterium]|nr:tRNA pseudouridine(38-40) synthase TruA [Clostridia bacterium]
MKNIKLVIEYDGTAYCGWQYQPNGPSIQQIMEDAVFRLTGEHTRLHGSGRTDAGVHALGQTANFHTESKIPPAVFGRALNQLLPGDISIISSCRVADEFHSRFDARGKHYRYLIFNRQERSPFFENRAYRYGKEIDLSKMKAAALHFKGTHDFLGFMASGSDIEDTTRIIYGIDIGKDGDLIGIDITGSGFLYNMVRIISGTLLECGIGRREPSEIPDIILSGDRKAAGRTLPAHGLYLVRVIYD